MFPIRDHNPSHRVPVITYALILLNVVIFLGYAGDLNNPRVLNAFFLEWALIPRLLTDGVQAHTLLTSMFLHGGWMHLIGNMLFLYVFGDNMEDQLGHVGFLAFYLAGGIGASLAHVIAAPFSVIPMVGASGAIAAVMGGYLLLFPRARVDVLVFLVVIVWIIPIPAWIMLGVWFGIQVFSGLGAAADGPGVAYWAHAGGFLIGLGLTLPFWLARGGPRFWSRTHGLPPHVARGMDVTRVPVVRRRR